MALVNQPGDNAQNRNTLELEIEAERFVIRLENAPAVVEDRNTAVDVIRTATDAAVQVFGLVGDTAPGVIRAATNTPPVDILGSALIMFGAFGDAAANVVGASSNATVKVVGKVADTARKVAAADYSMYKLANTPAFLEALTRVVKIRGEAFIEKVRAGSLEITLIAENQQTAEKIRQSYEDGTLLRQFNIALGEYGKAYNDPQRAFTEIVLTQPENAKVGLGDLESLRKKADGEMKQASNNGIKYERNLHKSGSYVEVKKTEKIVTTKPKTRKLEIKDIESVFDLLEIVKTEKYKKSRTSSDQVLDETLTSMMGYFQYYKLYMNNHEFDQVGVVKNKMLKLIETNFVASGDDIKPLADKILAKGNNYEAILFYEISAIFYSRENSLKVAIGINNCMFGIYKSLEGLSVKHKAEIERVTCDYVIPVMRDLLQSVENMNKIETKERVQRRSWCLYRIGESYELVKEYDSSLSTLFEARNLMTNTYGKDVVKYKLYGAILNNIGVIYHRMSVVKEAAKYFNLAIEATKQANHFSSADDLSNDIKAFEKNLSFVSK